MGRCPRYLVVTPVTFIEGSRVQTPGMSQPSRAVLVTGASRGIGAAVAREFAAAGDRVGVHYRSAQEAAEQTLESLAGDGHVIAMADLRDPAAVRSMVDAASSALGGIDVLVNNAGIFVA